MITEIGFAAGNIWKKLKEEGEMVITKLMRKSGLPINMFYMGLGWLAREDKIKFRRERRTIYVSLKE
ncbi:MAG: winged helix-turn-helix domain-containing protein [candidate division WOR-3 bacterium]